MNILLSILSGTNTNDAPMVSHLIQIVAEQIPVKALHSTPFGIERGVPVSVGPVSGDGSRLCSCQLPSNNRDCSLFPSFLSQVAFLLANNKEFCLLHISGSSQVHHHRCALTQPKAAINFYAVDIKSLIEPYINSEGCSSKLHNKQKTRRGILKNHAFRGASLCFCIAKTRLYGAPYWLTVSSLQSTNRQPPIEKLGIPCRVILGSSSGTHVLGIGLFRTTAHPFSYHYLTKQVYTFHSLP